MRGLPGRTPGIAPLCGCDEAVSQDMKVRFLFTADQELFDAFGMRSSRMPW